MDVLKGFSSPWKGFCDHPPLSSSLNMQAFLGFQAHHCTLFSECTKPCQHKWKMPKLDFQLNSVSHFYYTLRFLYLTGSLVFFDTLKETVRTSVQPMTTTTTLLDPQFMTMAFLSLHCRLIKWSKDTRVPPMIL